MNGRKKIGPASLARHQKIHIAEDQQVSQRLSGNDDQRDARDFAQAPVRVDPDTSDKQRSKDTDEESCDGQTSQAKNVPAVPRGIRRGQGGFDRLDVGKIALCRRDPFIAVIAGSSRNLDGH
jgi:hypothetical protein